MRRWMIFGNTWNETAAGYPRPAVVLRGQCRTERAARAAIEDENNQRYVSHATAWEVAIKCSLDRLKLQVPHEDLFPGAVLSNGFNILPLDFRHYRALLDLPFHHRDPFDRLLIAQAQVEGMRIITCDFHSAAYDVPLLW